MHAILHRVVPTLSALTVGFSLSAVASCTGASQQKAKDVTTTVLDAGSAICQAIANAPGMPDAVKVICEYVDKADGLAKIFIATVPRAQAKAMGMVLPCPDVPSGPSPSPSAPASATASATPGLAPLPDALKK
jgi:hypothetical protein